MHRSIRLTFCLVLAFITTNDHSASGQRVYSNSRAAASAHPPRQSTATGGFSTGRTSGTRWGIPGQPSASDWTLRPPVSSGRSSSTHGNSGPHSHRSHGSIHYSVPLPSIQYSPYIGPLQYGNYGGPVIYGAPGYGNFGYGHHGLSPYDRVRIQNGLPPGYSNNYAPYGAIATPPIIIPFGGVGSTFSQAPAPLPQSSAQAPPGMLQHQLPPVPEVGTETFSKKIATDERPVVNEFHVQRPIDAGAATSTVDRIRSLRYQTSGDSEFREQDFAAAATLYEAAAKTAPDRRAPWIRKAWAEVSLEHFDEAAASLKTAMLLSDDPTNSWIPGEQLYGSQFARDAALLNEPLLQWLQERPNSTDRLLLVAGFQQLQGYTGTARELINAALQKGLQRDIVDAFEEIINDRAGDGDRPNQKQTPAVEVGAAEIHDPNVVEASQQVEQVATEIIGAPVAIDDEPLGPRVFSAPQTLDAQPAAEFPLVIPKQ